MFVDTKAKTRGDARDPRRTRRGLHPRNERGAAEWRAPHDGPDEASLKLLQLQYALRGPAPFLEPQEVDSLPDQVSQVRDTQ